MSYDEERMFCDCGVTLGYGEDECSACAGAPHHRECPCDACEEYWAGIERKSKIAAEAFNRRLVCTCGWTGPYPEHHRDRRPDCEVNLRESVAPATTQRPEEGP